MSSQVLSVISVPSMLPSGDANDTDESLRALGTGAGTAASGEAPVTVALDSEEPDAVTAEAVATTAATDTTPFGYSEAQANAIRVTVNKLVVDVTALIASLTDTQADVAAVKDALDTLGLTD